jgi:glutathione S-transferase
MSTTGVHGGPHRGDHVRTHRSQDKSTMPQPTAPIRLHRFGLSGHAHRAELFLSLLQLPCERIEVDLPRKAQKRPGFLALNPFGKVPVIEDGDVVVADSAAILVYLALRYDPSGRWLPRDPYGAAQVQRWLSIAAGPLVNGAANARWQSLTGRTPDAAQTATANELLAQMEAHLSTQAFLVGSTPTIADIALYSYTAHAPEGEVSLEPYAQVRAWLARIEALPGFIDMPRGAAARAAVHAALA